MRAARRTDLDRLLELERAHAGDAFGRQQLHYLLNRANAVTLVAEEESGSPEARVVGDAILLFRRGGASAHLYSLTVEAESRGRGVGRLLLQRAEEVALARGLRRMRLEVRVDNRAAIRLYRETGFTGCGLRAGYYSDGCTALCMEKELSSPSSPAR